jgi:hypothetical protein
MRRFPAPWTVEQIPGGSKGLDANGQSIAYVYGRETDADIAKVLGFTDEGLANFFGVDERTINRWKIEREEFLSARGRRPINAKAESLYAWGSENVADARHR